MHHNEFRCLNNTVVGHFPLLFARRLYILRRGPGGRSLARGACPRSHGRRCAMKSGAAGKKVTDLKEGGLRIGPYEVGQIMDRLGAGALLVDLSTRAILRANEAFCRLSGFKAADIERIDLAQLHQLDDLEWILSNAVHPEKADQILPAAACAGKDEKPWSADVRLTGLTEGGGSVVLLTYSPPEGSPAKRSKAPRPSAAAPVLASVPAPTVAPAPP